MKIKISIPDELAATAEALARQLGVSRKDLIVAAIADFVARNVDNDVTARLDRLYATDSSGLDPYLRHAQRESINEDEYLKERAKRGSPEKYAALAQVPDVEPDERDRL
ncbi:MAG TPA: ribbon-helix-helix protein, CopG family [Longimicrobium sp.]|nr:ribbon-helix-helix protein, CopG family [Longimicrobium sp.]